MAPNYKDKEGGVIASISGRWISILHTVAASAAFGGALIVGIHYHYHKIVQNEFYGYPDEWFPSVSATIGDRHPERSLFQLFIAITSGPRFILVLLFYVMTARRNASLPKIVCLVGIFRALTCGGWSYVTSTDNHHWHDVLMISYIVATLPWNAGCIALTSNPVALKYRKRFMAIFFGNLVPLIYFFIQHKVHRVAGAYSIYALFEWSAVLLDVAFDAVTYLDFDGLQLVVKDVKGISKGDRIRVANTILEKENDKSITQTLGGSFSWNDLLDATADVYNGYVFWSILTSLGVTIWYFPLWHMGISGYEIVVLSSISPVLLANARIRSLVIQNIRTVQLLSLSGIAAYLIKSPETRLFTVAFATSMTCLAWPAAWFADRSHPARLETRINAWSIGLIASSIAKFAFWTNNPIWPIMHAENGGWNKVGLLLAVLAVLRSTRRRTGNPGEPVGKSLSGTYPSLAGLGLAGLFFGLHSLLSDSSTMILWCWEGYPVNGPLASPHGAWTILAMGAGLMFGLFCSALANSWTLFGIGALGAALLTLRTNWIGFYGALVLAFYLLAMTPILLTSATRHPPASTFGLGFLLYNVLVLAHVWIVAYAFVPGGPLLRERTDLVMIAMMLLIACGVFSSIASTTHLTRAPLRTHRASSTVTRARSSSLYVLMALQLLSVSIAYLRFPNPPYSPHHPQSRILTAGIWTVHFSLDNDMWSSHGRLAHLIQELELDVVGLLETDLQRIIMGNRDTTQYIAETLGFHVDYGPGPNKHTWGAALLSKFPIMNSTHHLLPSPVGELAPAIHATIDAYGQPVDIVVFHSGQEEDAGDRGLQAEYLESLMGSVPKGRPLVLLSYLVVRPGEGNYNRYVDEGRTQGEEVGKIGGSGMRDIDRSDWDRWCEYILYKGLKRVGYARVSRSTITDTELQVGKFLVGEPEGSDDRISEEHVPEDWRFPKLFGGEGVRGHRYHVFDEPRYYQ